MTDHPEFGLLDEYVLGTLDRREALRVAKHVETCLICRRECDELRSIFDVLPLAIAPTAPPPALRDRILAAADAPRPRFSGVTLAGALAAALLIALAGDAFLASRLVANNAVIAVASPTPAPTPTPTPTPTMHVTPAEPRAHAKVARPDSNAALPHPSAPASSATALAPVLASSAAAVGAKAREARDTLTIARLKRELAVVQRQSRIDRRRLHLLEGELARAQSVPRAVAQAPTFAPTATTAPSSPSPNDMPTSTSPDGALVATLRSGKVYTIDGTVGGEAWHLTILQPLQGERAVMYSGTPDAPSGQTYRTWVLRDGHTVDVGELAPGKPATLQMPMALEPGDVIAFSREPIGTGDLPTQPFLMQLKIDH